MSNVNEPKPGYYRHFKHGHIYVVMGTVLHTETNERLVLYRRFDKDGFFARPVRMFNALVPKPEPKLGDAVFMPRFKPLTRDETLALFQS